MLQNFKTDLLSFSASDIFRKYFYDSSTSMILDSNQVLNLKNSIVEKFKVAYPDIIIVGSARLGFSIKESRRFMDFGEESDIDVAIVSDDLFAKIWEETIQYINESGGAYPKKRDFFKYLAQKGWIRPDMLPTSEYFPFTNEWKEFFRELTNSGTCGRYPISAGIYYSSFFLEQYQIKSISQCQIGVTNENNSN